MLQARAVRRVALFSSPLAQPLSSSGVIKADEKMRIVLFHKFLMYLVATMSVVYDSDRSHSYRTVNVGKYCI